jgi:hypothetical protein
MLHFFFKIFLFISFIIILYSALTPNIEYWMSGTSSTRAPQRGETAINRPSFLLHTLGSGGVLGYTLSNPSLSTNISSSMNISFKYEYLVQVRTVVSSTNVSQRQFRAVLAIHQSTGRSRNLNGSHSGLKI